MKQLLFFRFLAARRGATVMEYTLIASGIAVAIAALVYAIGDDLLSLYTQVQTEVFTSH